MQRSPMAAPAAVSAEFASSGGAMVARPPGPEEDPTVEILGAPAPVETPCLEKWPAIAATKPTLTSSKATVAARRFEANWRTCVCRRRASAGPGGVEELG